MPRIVSQHQRPPRAETIANVARRAAAPMRAATDRPRIQIVEQAQQPSAGGGAA